MRENPKPFEIYKHFKGNLYQILTLAIDSEDGSCQVVYQALYGEYKVYVRPLSMFMSDTDKEKYPNAEQKFRFEKIESATEIESEVNQPATSNKNVTKLSPETERRVEDSIIADKVVNELASEELKDYQEELNLDPSVIEFLDASTYEERLNILTSLHHRITDEMINTMAVSVDVEIDPGPIEERYLALKNCLLTKDKFERVRHR